MCGSADGCRKSLAKALASRKMNLPVKTVEAITEERGSQYGHPLHHFHATQDIYRALARHLEHQGMLSDMPQSKADVVRHGMFMIVDKLVRACTSPMKEDHWDDVMGYARTVKMGLGMIPDESADDRAEAP